MDLDEAIEIGRQRLAKLREKYHPDSLAAGTAQASLRPEEFDILLVAGTESTADLEALRPTRLRWPTVMYVTEEQLERILNVHLRPTRGKNAPRTEPKQRPSGQSASESPADVHG